jgi:hypothetical protein
MLITVKDFNCLEIQIMSQNMLLATSIAFFISSKQTNFWLMVLNFAR